MTSVHVNSALGDDDRRRQLYEGHLFVFPAKASTKALCEFARNMIEDAFPGLDPRTAQEHMPVEEYVRIVAPLKPKFIHHPESKRLIRGILEEFGCDPDQVYQDVPRLRMVTHSGYLTSGVGYAHHPHRDTWYSAPMCQLNWWLPIYDIVAENSMAFHPAYWDRPVRNGSSEFNYYRWNAESRGAAAQHIRSDTRPQPKPLEPMELEPAFRFVPEAGGVVLFSAAQMHSTVPNTSKAARYSIDFRTVHAADVLNVSGAPNIDSHCTGTSLRDFVRTSDGTRFPEEAIAGHDSGSAEGTLVYQPGAMGAAS